VQPTEQGAQVAYQASIGLKLAPARLNIGYHVLTSSKVTEKKTFMPNKYILKGAFYII
jgi:hypothetical protein